MARGLVERKHDDPHGRVEVAAQLLDDLAQALDLALVVHGSRRAGVEQDRERAGAVEVAGGGRDLDPGEGPLAVPPGGPRGRIPGHDEVLVGRPAFDAVGRPRQLGADLHPGLELADTRHAAQRETVGDARLGERFEVRELDLDEAVRRDRKHPHAEAIAGLDLEQRGVTRARGVDEALVGFAPACALHDLAFLPLPRDLHREASDHRARRQPELEPPLDLPVRRVLEGQRHFGEGDRVVDDGRHPHRLQLEPRPVRRSERQGARHVVPLREHERHDRAGLGRMQRLRVAARKRGEHDQ